MMNRLAVRWAVAMVAMGGVPVATAGAAVRARSAPLTASQRTMISHAASRAAAGLRTVTGATVRLKPPTPRKPPPTPVPPPPTPTPATPPPATTITVDAADPGATVSPALFGSDFLAPFGGMGSFNDAAGAFYPTFLSQVSQVSPGSLRFPGGITSQSYQWENAIGPQVGRLDNPVGPNGRPSPSTVGPDEFGQLLDATGASGVADVDFANGTAQEAADFVHYMTDPAGSSALAQRRANDGHPAPYNVPYWEVGNEQQTPQYWLAGSLVQFNSGAAANCAGIVNTCLYIYGGTTRFSNQAVVLPSATGDRSPAAGVSKGTPGQTFQVQFPPVSSLATPAIHVGGATWTKVGSLATASSTDPDYTLDAQSGTITFGDGSHGAIPPNQAAITATYDSGPHQGFNAFYTAMKAANPSINVCATDTAVNFVNAMASQPYDCLQDHPYVGMGDISPSTPIDQYESQVMAVPDVSEVSAVQSLQALVHQVAGPNIPLVLTEYGQLINSTPDANPLDPDAPNYYLNSLDEALVNASQLADWIKLGIPVADRQLLDAQLPDPSVVTAGLPGAAPFAVTGAIATPGETAAPGSSTVLEPTGQSLGLMKPLAGGALLDSSIAANPQLTTLGSTDVGDLSTVSAATAAGIQLVVINRSPTDDVAASVAFSGVSASGTASVTALDGPSPLSDNTAAAPTTVTTTASTAPVTAGTTALTFPAHSVTLVSLPGT
jgi:alpha-N-arabinofuranosidase